MKTILATMALVASVSVSANDREGFYLGANLGHTEIDINDTSIVSEDNNYYAIQVGYQFQAVPDSNFYIGVEAEYQDLGDIKIEGKPNSNKSYSLKADSISFGLNVKPKYYVDNFYILGIAGIHFANADHDLFIQDKTGKKEFNYTSSGSLTGIAVTFGVEAGYEFRNFNLGVGIRGTAEDYEYGNHHVSLDLEQDSQQIYANLGYRF